MLKIGLIDVDSHNFPNLALMKLSAYHKARGDAVEWWAGPMEEYDLVYKSRVFDDTYTIEDTITQIRAKMIICGGTGYDLHNKQPDAVEHQYPDYALYPNHPEAYGFLTRGCPRGCPFCIVGQKEGRRSRQVADLSEFWRGQERIKLLDPNLLAAPEYEQLLCRLASSGAEVDFTQGLDARLLTPDNIALLKQVNFKRTHFAWDREQDGDLILSKLQLLPMYGIKPWRITVYVLTNYETSFEFDLYRVYTLRRLGMDPYVMIYDKPHAAPEYLRLHGWVNNRQVWNECERFEDFDRAGHRHRPADGQVGMTGHKETAI